MTEQTQPEALRLAAWLNEGTWHSITLGDVNAAGRELRRLHTENAQLKAQLAQRERPALTDEPVTGQVRGPLIARQLGEWHEDDGAAMWWAWNGHEWAGEPAWCGTPHSSDWPGYHTHWTPHPDQPVAHGIGDPT